MRRTLSSLAVWLGVSAVFGADSVPDFQLIDVNTNSTRALAKVSPRDYLLQVSGYYFGHAG